MKQFWFGIFSRHGTQKTTTRDETNARAQKIALYKRDKCFVVYSLRAVYSPDKNGRKKHFKVKHQHCVRSNFFSFFFIYSRLACSLMCYSNFILASLAQEITWQVASIYAHNQILRHFEFFFSHLTAHIICIQHQLKIHLTLLFFFFLFSFAVIYLKTTQQIRSSVTHCLVSEAI